MNFNPNSLRRKYQLACRTNQRAKLPSLCITKQLFIQDVLQLPLTYCKYTGSYAYRSVRLCSICGRETNCKIGDNVRLR